MKECPNCKGLNSEGSQFCGSCGASLLGLQTNTNNVNQQTSSEVQKNYDYQQDINQNVENVNMPKKKSKALKVGLLILGGFVFLILLYIVLFSISEKQENVWESGIVQIMGTKIQLPCDISQFERNLNTKIYDYENDFGSYGSVKLKTNNGLDLKFKVQIDNNKVEGILLEANGGFTYDSNDRVAANYIIFPGDVTISSDINEVKEKYKTKPLNIWHNPFSEKIDNYISSSYNYHNDNWEIDVHTMKKINSNDEVITEITYWQLDENDF